VNKEVELFALDAIEELKKALSRLSTTTCVWNPGSDWHGFVGTPANALAHALADSAVRPDIYVCGPPALIEAVETIGMASGIAHAAKSFRLLDPMSAKDLDKAALLDDSARRQAFGSLVNKTRRAGRPTAM